MKSYSLFEEIICTIQNIAEIMTQDAMNILGQIMNNPNLANEDSSLILVYLRILNSIVCLFYQMNFQDFPEFFEDNLASWMNIIKALLEFNLPQNFLNDKNIFKEFLKLKTKTLRSLNLYCCNYYDDFKVYHDSFIQPVWNLLLFTKNNDIFFKLTKELLDYYRTLYTSTRINCTDVNVGEISQHITQNLIIPNMTLTSKELDDFEESPVNFLKVELEETDMESSKSQNIIIKNKFLKLFFKFKLDKYFAVNVLKAIIQNNKNILDGYIRPLIDNLLNSYHENPNKNWMNKITAINLIFGSMIKTYASKCTTNIPLV